MGTKTSHPKAANETALQADPRDMRRLRNADHSEPHRILGAHPVSAAHGGGVVVRAFHPDAMRGDCRVGNETHPMRHLGDGLFAVHLPAARLPLPHEITFHFPDGNTWTLQNPYAFLPTLGDVDLHLFNEGTHRRLWERLGAHVRTIDGVEGVAFSVWAPNARRVSVVGDFNNWDGRILPMRQMGASGVFELFVPGIQPGLKYKFEIRTRDGALRVKTDPFAAAMEHPPASASIVYESSYKWNDAGWIAERRRRNPLHQPISIYEVHLGSWARVPEEGDRPLTYRELAPRLVAHVKRFGFTHLELLPIAEHPFGGSWGYQVTGYYAPTARYGEPNDFRWFVDFCHQNGVGVILDWVPAHFPKDDFALRRFDGTALFEHADPREGEHPDWGTLIFNYGRNEVRNFLVANALYWFDEFHIDGLRVDAVASMLYRDYSRKPGEWIPNRYGGRENLEAIQFLRELNEAVGAEFPGGMMIAEESTAWPGVTRMTSYGGLGFTFKWNMGWMHDTLLYFSKDPVHRRYHHDALRFSMVYEFHEQFVNPLSHDEVVHGKRTLLEKMPGDLWQKFANLRNLLAYQFTRPGKKLLFMGTELAPYIEWSYDRSLDWHLASDSWRAGLARFLEQLGRLYLESPALWRSDGDPSSFEWIDHNDVDNSVYSYRRRSGDDELLVVLNLTPVPRENYRIGAPRDTGYRVRLCSDDPAFCGSGVATGQRLLTEPVPWHGRRSSLRLTLPPLAALVLVPE